MKPSLQRQLDQLRRRVRRIERNGPPGLEPEAPRAPAGEASEEDPAHYGAERIFDGQVIENAWGRYFVTERFYPARHRHGSFEISGLSGMPGRLLEGVSQQRIPAHDPSRWAFLDTETTGLAGGTGTCAFLVGVGVIEDGGFRVRLFFMRDYDEERAMLAGLAEFLRWYDVLVTYNGKTYDGPLLETRYRLARQQFPLERMHHLDLLHGARQLWKLRMESCRLMQLEAEILGFLREGDLPGEMVPYYYFEYLRTRQAFRLVPLFHHNVMDIVTLACLTAVALPAFSSPEDAPLRHGGDLLGLARWLRRRGRLDQARGLYRRALRAGLPDGELCAALWECAGIEKKLANYAEMVRLLEEAAQMPGARRREALEELAKYHERREKNYPRALEYTLAALKEGPTPDLLRRKSRLERRASAARGKNGGARDALFG